MKKFLSVLMTVIMMASILVAPALAIDGDFPSPAQNYTVTAEVKDGVGGTVNVDPSSVPQGENSVITATPADGYDFAGWTFTGDFEWVEGDANSLRIVVKPTSDCHFIAAFKGKGGPGGDDNPFSPGTGYDMSAAIAVMAIVFTIGAASVVVAGRKYFCEK